MSGGPGGIRGMGGERAEHYRSRDDESRSSRNPAFKRPPLRLQTTTLWEYPSQHYTSAGGKVMQGDKDYVGATPSWVIWQLLTRYTREGDTVVDPFCGSGTTLDVCTDLQRQGIGFDLTPRRPDIRPSSAIKLPLPDASADFVFMDPPYGAHVRYSENAGDIGHHDVHEDAGRERYFEGMAKAIFESHRILKDRRYFALYVSDSYKKPKGEGGNNRTGFVPIGFELFNIMCEYFHPADIISVVRHNQKLGKGNWHKAAEEGNFFLRGFNYLFIMKKQDR
jgi:DNA modification methylase